MKQLGVALLLAAMLVGFASCKKNYECTCITTQDSSGDTVQTQTMEGEYTKSDAEEWCSGSASSGGLSVDCVLEEQ